MGFGLIWIDHFHVHVFPLMSNSKPRHVCTQELQDIFEEANHRMLSSILARIPQGHHFFSGVRLTESSNIMLSMVPTMCQSTFMLYVVQYLLQTNVLCFPISVLTMYLAPPWPQDDRSHNVHDAFVAPAQLVVDQTIGRAVCRHLPGQRQICHEQGLQDLIGGHVCLDSTAV